MLFFRRYHKMPDLMLTIQALTKDFSECKCRQPGAAHKGVLSLALPSRATRSSAKPLPTCPRKPNGPVPPTCHPVHDRLMKRSGSREMSSVFNATRTDRSKVRHQSCGAYLFIVVKSASPRVSMISTALEDFQGIGGKSAICTQTTLASLTYKAFSYPSHVNNYLLYSSSHSWSALPFLVLSFLDLVHQFTKVRSLFYQIPSSFSGTKSLCSS